MYKLLCKNLSDKSLTNFTKTYKKVISNYENHRHLNYWKRKFPSETNVRNADETADGKEEATDNEELKSHSSNSFFRKNLKRAIFSPEKDPSIRIVMFSTNSSKYFYSSIINQSKNPTQKKKTFRNEKALQMYKTALEQCMKIKFNRYRFNHFERNVSWLPQPVRTEKIIDEKVQKSKKPPPVNKNLSLTNDPESKRRIEVLLKKSREKDATRTAKTVSAKSSTQFKTKRYRITYPTHVAKYKLPVSKPHSINQTEAAQVDEELYEQTKKKVEKPRTIKVQKVNTVEFIPPRPKVTKTQDSVKLLLKYKPTKTEETPRKDEIVEEIDVEIPRDELVSIKQHPIVEKASKKETMAIMRKYNKLLLKIQNKPKKNFPKPSTVTDITEDPDFAAQNEENTEEQKCRVLETQSDSKIVQHPAITMRERQTYDNITVKYPKKILVDKNETYDLEDVCIKEKDKSGSSTKHTKYNIEAEEKIKMLAEKTTPDTQISEGREAGTKAEEETEEKRKNIDLVKKIMSTYKAEAKSREETEKAAGDTTQKPQPKKEEKIDTEEQSKNLIKKIMETYKAEIKHQELVRDKKKTAAADLEDYMRKLRQLRDQTAVNRKIEISTEKAKSDSRNKEKEQKMQEISIEKAKSDSRNKEKEQKMQDISTETAHQKREQKSEGGTKKIQPEAATAGNETKKKTTIVKTEVPLFQKLLDRAQRPKTSHEIPKKKLPTKIQPMKSKSTTENVGKTKIFKYLLENFEGRAESARKQEKSQNLRKIMEKYKVPSLKNEPNAVKSEIKLSTTEINKLKKGKKQNVQQLLEASESLVKKVERPPKPANKTYLLNEDIDKKKKKGAAIPEEIEIEVPDRRKPVKETPEEKPKYLLEGGGYKKRSKHTLESEETKNTETPPTKKLKYLLEESANSATVEKKPKYKNRLDFTEEPNNKPVLAWLEKKYKNLLEEETKSQTKNLLVVVLRPEKKSNVLEEIKGKPTEGDKKDELQQVLLAKITSKYLLGEEKTPEIDGTPSLEEPVPKIDEHRWNNDEEPKHEQPMEEKPSTEKKLSPQQEKTPIKLLEDPNVLTEGKNIAPKTKICENRPSIPRAPPFDPKTKDKIKKERPKTNKDIVLPPKHKEKPQMTEVSQTNKTEVQHRKRKNELVEIRDVKKIKSLSELVEDEKVKEVKKLKSDTLVDNSTKVPNQDPGNTEGSKAKSESKAKIAEEYGKTKKQIEDEIRRKLQFTQQRLPTAKAKTVQKIDSSQNLVEGTQVTSKDIPSKQPSNKKCEDEPSSTERFAFIKVRTVKKIEPKGGTVQKMQSKDVPGEKVQSPVRKQRTKDCFPFVKISQGLQNKKETKKTAPKTEDSKECFPFTKQLNTKRTKSEENLKEAKNLQTISSEGCFSKRKRGKFGEDLLKAKETPKNTKMVKEKQPELAPKIKEQTAAKPTKNQLPKSAKETPRPISRAGAQKPSNIEPPKNTEPKTAKKSKSTTEIQKTTKTVKEKQPELASKAKEQTAAKPTKNQLPKSAKDTPRPVSRASAQKPSNIEPPKNTEPKTAKKSKSTTDIEKTTKKANDKKTVVSLQITRPKTANPKTRAEKNKPKSVKEAKSVQNEAKRVDASKQTKPQLKTDNNVKPSEKKLAKSKDLAPPSKDTKTIQSAGKEKPKSVETDSCFPFSNPKIKQTKSDGKLKEHKTKEVKSEVSLGGKPKEPRPSPKELRPSSKELTRSPKELVPSPKQLKGTPKEPKVTPKEIEVSLGGKPKEPRPSSKEARPNSKELTPSPRDLGQSPKQLKVTPKEPKVTSKELGPSSKELKASPKDLQASPKDAANEKKNAGTYESEVCYPKSRRERFGEDLTKKKDDKCNKEQKKIDCKEASGEGVPEKSPKGSEETKKEPPKIKLEDVKEEAGEKKEPKAQLLTDKKQIEAAKSKENHGSDGIPAKANVELEKAKKTIEGTVADKTESGVAAAKEEKEEKLGDFDITKELPQAFLPPIEGNRLCPEEKSEGDTKLSYNKHSYHDLMLYIHKSRTFAKTDDEEEPKDKDKP